MENRRSFSYRAVFLGLAASLLLAAAAAVFIYFTYVRYERVAARHLPPGAQAALRIDVEKVVLFEPVRRHVFPLVEERSQAAATGARPSRLERIQSATGIELAVDLRELVVGWGPGPTDWVLVLGGLFPRKGVLEGLERVLQEEGFSWRRTADGVALVGPGGIAWGQATDGALIGASSERLLRSALPPTDSFQRLGLSLSGPGGFGVSGQALRTLAPSPLRTAVPALSLVEDVRRVHGDAELGSDVAVTSFIDLERGSAEQVAESIRSLSGGARRLGWLPAVPGRPLLEVAERLEPTVESPHTVRVTARWSREEVDKAAAELARALRRLFGWA